MILVIVLVLLVVGTVLFHFLSPWWFTPLASNWGDIDSTINITFWVTGVVFIAVNLFMAYAIFRYRFHKDSKAHYEPENKKLEIWLTGITTLGVVAMLAPGLFVWAKFVDIPEEAMTFEVVGRQWHWMYRFPGEDEQLGRSDARFINESNPFGLDPQDPAGQDDVLVFSNILHLPVGQPVKVLLRSQDVLHSFAVPQFRAKMDMVPGMVTQMWFEPTRTGMFDIVCMQLCGMAHHAMRGRVVVEEIAAFQTWLSSHPTFVQTRNPEPANVPMGQALYAVCSACHGQQGEGNLALHAPKISGLNRWYLERQLHYYKIGVRGSHELDTYGQQMAAMTATLTDASAIRNVSAYIGTLADKPAPATIDGNLRRGESYYASCKNCHGEQGEGNYATNAPKLVGQHDWYLAQQIDNFKRGIRGSHTQDLYGMQMILMAKVLQNEQAIADLVAYINSLNTENTENPPVATH
jgi:cytochrome c oxidase subunit 2